MVPLKRPHPNVLIAEATVNGRKLRLLVDTGALVDGIVLQSDKAEGLGLTPEAVKETARSATGVRFPLTTARADRVSMGNLELRSVRCILET